MPKLARVPANDGGGLDAAIADRGRAPRPRGRYYAFLSYSHQDEELADWLHRELEEFRVPPALAGRLTANGVIPKRLAPIFRDQHELAAADDLGDEIREALASSQYLVVLCSPAAAKSHWTNAEIETFKRTRPDGCVLAAIASGEPFASDISGREDEECFPPALRQRFDRRGRPTGKRSEPLAADLRDEEDRRLGVLKLVAGMLGVGLDDLVQRETTRRHRRLAWLAAASLGGMAVTSTLAVTAIHARDAAREQRRQAESLVAFMLGDLKDKLEPIGRLDALDGVGSRVLAYYSKQDTSELSDAALLQRSRALSLMGQVASLRGNTAGAMRFYREAETGTTEAIRRNPTDPQRLYDHAQNVFWVASLDVGRGNLAAAETGMREYKRLAQQMVAIDPNNMKWRMEDQDADVNLGFVLYNRRHFSEAVNLFGQAVQMIQAFAIADPHNGEYQQNLADSLAWLADAEMSNGQLDAAIDVRQQHIAVLRRQISQPHSDVQYRQKLIPAEEGLGWLYAMRGQPQLALQHFRSGVDAANELLPVEPTNTLWLEYAMSVRFRLAETLAATNQVDQSAAETEAACVMVQQLLARDPHYPSWRSGARACWTQRARLALIAGRNEEALRAARRAVAIGRTKTTDPADASYSISKAALVLGDAQRTLGNSIAATAAWQAGLAALSTGAGEKPYELAQHAVMLRRLGRAAEAAPIAARLRTMGFVANSS
jgi:tetratricopeptide (TPR) repeat protein